jgi:hypothetical protein
VKSRLILSASSSPALAAEPSALKSSGDRHYSAGEYDAVFSDYTQALSRGEARAISQIWVARGTPKSSREPKPPRPP